MGVSEAARLPSYLYSLTGLTMDEERALLLEIFTRGWDQGCLILDSYDLSAPGLAPHVVKALLDQVACRASLHPSGDAADPFEREPMPQRIPDEESGLVVLGQRCDLLKPLRSEPLVEVALAHCSGDHELVAAARNGGSACCIHLADQCEGSDSAWIVDLRTRGLLPKHWLRGRTPAHLLAPGRARRRFAARLGERNSRIPVPNEIVEGFQGKLRGWLYSSGTRRAQCAHFSELLLLESEDGSWAVLAILGEGKDADRAIGDFDALLGAIVDRVGDFPVSSEYSGVLRVDELSHADFQDAYKLDFSRVTYGSKSLGTAQAESVLGQG
jgi:hypothetical protein